MLVDFLILCFLLLVCVVSDAHSWTCMDLYLFATPYRVTWDYYLISREHTLEFDEWEGRAEYEYGENANLAFLEKHMGANFEPRPQPWVTNITVDEIQSGDFLAISKIRGRWGGFETLEKWVSGAYAGHSAVCLRDSQGKLWVGESGHENEEVNYSLLLSFDKLSYSFVLSLSQHPGY
ncbi:hypothetical protein LINPERPRIM_LOCUS5502 [Linum perenne]